MSGSIFLGEVNEPIRSTSNPYGKMEMGIPFTKRPVRLIFDYKYKASPDDFRTESTGFSSRKQLAGRDSAEVYILLQHRWEDEDGNVYAIVFAGYHAFFANGIHHFPPVARSSF